MFLRMAVCYSHKVSEGLLSNKGLRSSQWLNLMVTAVISFEPSERSGSCVPSVLPPGEKLESTERLGAAAQHFLVFLHTDSRGRCGGRQRGSGGGGCRAEFSFSPFHMEEPFLFAFRLALACVTSHSMSRTSTCSWVRIHDVHVFSSSGGSLV